MQSKVDKPNFKSEGRLGKLMEKRCESLWARMALLT